MSAAVSEREFVWPDDDIDVHRLEREGWPVAHVTVTTPDDQAVLHRWLAVAGYCPVLIEETPHVHRWRFHHPDGPR